VSDALAFVTIFVGIFIFLFIVATVGFFLTIPRGDRCPNCDHPTLWVEWVVFDRVIPWFRKSWCLSCGWHGLLRRGDVSETTSTEHLSGKR
jgi:hypothetical protein